MIFFKIETNIKFISVVPNLKHTSSSISFTPKNYLWDKKKNTLPAPLV